MRPASVARLALGATLACVGLGIRAVALIVSGLGLVVSAENGVILAWSAQTFAWMWASVAWWILTAEPPRRHGRRAIARLLLRSLSVMGLAHAGIALIVAVSYSPDVSALVLSGIVLFYDLALRSTQAPIHALRLAERAEDPDLASRIRGMFKFFNIIALVVPVGLIGLVVTLLIPIVFPVTIVLAVPYLLLVLTLLVIAAVVWTRVSLSLRRTLWAAASAPTPVPLVAVDIDGLATEQPALPRAEQGRD